MSENDDWIKEFMSQDEVEQLQSVASRIIKSDGVYYEMNIMMSEEDMCEAVRNVWKMQNNDVQAWLFGISMLTQLVSTMAYALEENGINPLEDLL